MLFTKESERCRWRWRCCCTVSAALSLPAVRCLCSRLREARTFNTPSQPSPAQTSPAVVVCREPLLSPPQHHYLLPYLLPKVLTVPTLCPRLCLWTAFCLPGSHSPTTTYHYLLPPTRYLLLPDLTSPTTKLLDHVHVHIHIHAHAHVHHLHLHLPVCHACPQSHARTPSAATAAAAAPACFTSLHAWALLIPDLTLPYPPSIAV